MTKTVRPNRGFTLIELMVTLAIGVLLMMVAIPSLTTYKRNAELTSAANTLLAAINAARGEAMKRGRNAFVVPTNNGTNWNQGWVVFVDMNNSQTYTSTDTLVLSQAALPSTLTAVANGSGQASPPYVMFDASGYSKLKGSAGFGALTFSISRNDVTGTIAYDQMRLIKIASTGRVRICKPTMASDPNCSYVVSD